MVVDLARRFVHKRSYLRYEMLDSEAVAATMSAHTDDAREGRKACFMPRRTALIREFHKILRAIFVETGVSVTA